MRSTNSVTAIPPQQRERQPGTFTGVPSFIRAHCRKASRGGSGGYSEAGFQLGYHVCDLEPLDLETDEWLDLIDAELLPSIEREDHAAVIAWCVRRYPRVMALVPDRRRDSFAAGFVRGFAKWAEDS